MDILKPTSQLAKIYPIFHFIPGDPDAPSAARADACKDPWVTTPNSPVARKMLKSALASGNLYRIGVSAHGFVDTWAHQNFLGRRDDYNDLPGASWVKTLVNVGHGSAGHQPDQPALVWTDPRLVEARVDNRRRFLEAAEQLFIRLALHFDPGRDRASLAADGAALARDLNADIGPDVPRGDPVLRQGRIVRYVARAATAPMAASCSNTTMSTPGSTPPSPRRPPACVRNWTIFSDWPTTTSTRPPPSLAPGVTRPATPAHTGIGWLKR